MGVQPLVSVLMPNYNGERFIRQSIQSVLDQTYQNFELLIIDDGSTDGSCDIIRSFKDSRIRLEILPQNQNICYALNYGLQLAKGSYIARIDSDDCWFVDKLEKQITWMEEHQEYGACFTWVNVVDENDKILTQEESAHVSLFQVENRSQREWIRHFFFNGSCLCHPTAVFRTSVVDTVGLYDLVLVQIQDYDMWVRIAKQYPIYVLTEPLINYRWDSLGGNISTPTPKVRNRSEYEFYNVLSRYFDDMDDTQFIDVFSDDFIHKDAHLPKELMCEKALMLIRPLFCGYAPKLSGMNMLRDILNEDECRTILWEKYAVNQKNFYEISASPVLFHGGSNNTWLESNLSIRELIKEVLRRILKRYPPLFSFASNLYHKFKKTK